MMNCTAETDSEPHLPSACPLCKRPFLSTPPASSDEARSISRPIIPCPHTHRSETRRSCMRHKNGRPSRAEPSRIGACPLHSSSRSHSTCRTTSGCSQGKNLCGLPSAAMPTRCSMQPRPSLHTATQPNRARPQVFHVILTRSRLSGAARSTRRILPAWPYRLRPAVARLPEIPTEMPSEKRARTSLRAHFSMRAQMEGGSRWRL